MKNIKLANRYAKALYDFALEKEQVKEVYHDILFIIKLLEMNKDLNHCIESPIIPASKKKKVFSAIFKERVCAVTYGFLSLVLEKKREPALLLIAMEFVKLYYEIQNIKIVELVTTRPAGEDIIEKVRQILTRKTSATIEIRNMIKPEIIGGFIIKIDDYVYDKSIRRSVETLKRDFSQNPYKAGF